MNLRHYINDHFVTESYFWHAIQGMLNEARLERLMVGERIVIGGVSYQIVEE